MLGKWVRAENMVSLILLRTNLAGELKEVHFVQEGSWERVLSERLSAGPWGHHSEV
jgi:hypothetical protein